MRKIALTAIFCTILSAALCAQTYTFGTNTQQIRTLKVHQVNDKLSNPVIVLNSNNQIRISWDEMSHDFRRFSYRIIHCNQDWTKSEISLLEYMDGFAENDVEQYEKSYSTSTLYTHYYIDLPNNNVRFKYSGNYAVEFFDKDGDGKTLMTALFMLVDNKVSVAASITANTDIDFEKHHQQLSVEVKPAGLALNRPENEIKITVSKNRLREESRMNIKPKYVSPQKLTYEHDNDLIFEAGNEYRRFEITSFKHSGRNVNKVVFFKPFYNAELFPDEARLNTYVYDQDQNGKYLINNTDYDNVDVCSDYFLVHFSYPVKQPWIDGGLFLSGELVENKTDNNSKLIYNFERGTYEKTLMLKQGSYNYRYVFKPSGSNDYTLSKTEGSYWQTENEYQVYVYYRPFGGRYDQLVGFNEFKTKF